MWSFGEALDFLFSGIKKFPKLIDFINLINKDSISEVVDVIKSDEDKNMSSGINILMTAFAENARSIYHHDTDIMEHSRFFHKLPICPKFGMRIHNLKRTISHLTRMREENMLQFVLPLVIFIYQNERIHHFTGGF